MENFFSHMKAEMFHGRYSTSTDELITAISEAYSVAGETGFGWWLVEHYLSYHIDCPDGCGLGEPARGG